jgi:hypothetical protein
LPIPSHYLVAMAAWATRPREAVGAGWHPMEVTTELGNDELQMPKEIRSPKGAKDGTGFRLVFEQIK